MADPNTAPKERVRIFARDGSPLAEFRTQATRSWIIGDEGRLQFTYSTRKTDICNDDVLRPGNWILVQNDSLPPWVGVLDLPYNWGTRTVTISAYTPERVFDWRIGPLEEVVTGSAGTIFVRLIRQLNEAEQTIIRTGYVWRGGTQRQETLNPKKLKEYLRTLWENSGEDYTWQPAVGPDGKLTVRGSWVPVLGEESTALLHEGKGGGNIEAIGNIMVEDGPIVNSVLAYGGGETWKSKPNVTVNRLGSVGNYGLREDAVEYTETTSKTNLEENAKEYLSEFSRPSRTFAINALNVGDTWEYIGLGNILQLQLQSVAFRASGLGYRGRVRIIGMHYDPIHRNKIKLVLREVE